eukprot:323719_1
MVELNIASNKMMTLPADVFKSMKSLRRLALFMNKLIKLGADLSPLEGLEECQLNSNALCEWPNFGVHPKMKELNMTTNKLTAIPDDGLTGDKFPALESFEVSNNALQALPPSIGTVKTLTKLNASSNQIVGIPLQLFSCPELMTLMLEQNKLTGPLPDQIAQCTNMTNLLLQGNQLTSLPKCLTKVTKLTKVTLKGNMIPTTNDKEQKEIHDKVQAFTKEKGQ